MNIKFINKEDKLQWEKIQKTQGCSCNLDDEWKCQKHWLFLMKI